MEAATSANMSSFGLGPPHGAQHSQVAPGPSGAGGGGGPGHSGDTGPSRPEEPPHPHPPHPQQQQHSKPFFYIQPSQPFLQPTMQGLQWPVPVPMPMSYNPYYGFPGLGYGMPMMPPYQPTPYMDPPAFVLPTTHLHLMDYRRLLNPQYYQTMAYHSRRFRYQHNSPTREMTSSEVQTEPISANQRTSTPGSGNAKSSGAVQVHSRDPSPGSSTCQMLSPPSAVQNVDKSLEVKDPVSRSPPQNGSFLIQTEEVRIECRTTPVGLQLLHSHETAEVSHSLVQCGSILQGRVLPDETLVLPAAPDQTDQGLQACPDILLVGTPGSGEKIPALEEPKTQTDPQVVSSGFGSLVEKHGATQEKDLSVASKNYRFKVVHMPFDPKYLDELRRMESTVWSVEDNAIPSPENLHHNDLQDVTLVAEDPPEDSLMFGPEEEGVVPMIQMPPLEEDELEDLVPVVETQKPSETDTMEVPAAEEPPGTGSSHKSEVNLPPYLLLMENSPLQRGRVPPRRDANVQDHQDTSFESLPAYLPSTSWLADFDNVYYCNKLPPTPRKLERPQGGHGLDVPSRRRKLDLEYKDQAAVVRKTKERYKPKGKVDRRSLSDHECCLSRNFNENLFTPYAAKRDRLCSRCLTKRRILTSAGPGLDGRTLKRKAVPFQQWNEAPLPTCDACRSHPKKQLLRKGSSPDVGPRHGNDTEGDSSENGQRRRAPKWKAGDAKRPLAAKQNVDKSSEATHPKLREKNCVCTETQHQASSRERPRHCPHGNAIREMDENQRTFPPPVLPQEKWRSRDQIYRSHRWQTEKSWKTMTQNQDADISKMDATSQHFYKHKKPQPQSQGTRRKDTRC